MIAKEKLQEFRTSIAWCKWMDRCKRPFTFKKYNGKHPSKNKI